MPLYLTAALWALLGASALVAGALVGYFVRVPQKIVAGIMALGCGVLISAVAYDLLQDGFEDGGIWPIAFGTIGGALAYTLADILVARQGGKHRKRSGSQQMVKEEGGAYAIAIGSLLDGIPESIVLGVGLIAGDGISMAVLGAILLSNFPEGLSSSAGMRVAGRGPKFVFGVWGGIVVMSGLAAMAGAAFLANAPVHVLATVNAVAAGALFAMVVNTMIPEAVEGDHQMTGLLATLGLLVAFALTNLWG